MSGLNTYLAMTMNSREHSAQHVIAMIMYVFKPDMKKLISLDTEGLDTEGALRLNKVKKIVLGFLFALVVLLLLPNILPATSGIARFFKTIGNTGICMLLVTVMCLLKVDGKPLLRFKTMVDSGVTWGIILILAVVMPLSHDHHDDGKLGRNVHACTVAVDDGHQGDSRCAVVHELREDGSEKAHAQRE